MKRKAALLSHRLLSFALVTLLTAQAIGQTLSLVGSSRCDDLRRVQRRNDFAGNTVESIPALNGPGSSQRNDPTVASSPEPNKSAPIPMDQLGAVAGKQYHGDGLSVTATPDGARLRCAFQRLEGHVTLEGLWLSSTADTASGERFRVMAVEVGRADGYGLRRQSAAPTPLLEGHGMETALPEFQSGVATSFPPQSMTLPVKGSVLVKDHTARFIRDGLTEEYTVSVDGVRQDFIVEQRPGGEGELRVELDVTGAKAEPLVNGVRLVLDGSGRKLTYNRLRVVDATGRELPARMEVAAGVSPAVEGGILPPGRGARTTGVSGFHCDPFASSGISAGLEATALRQAETPAATRLAVLVDDAAAIYPVRIDPTFSDADWSSVGAPPGLDASVSATVVDNSGNLYVGGNFTIAGGISANRVAKWDGSAWSALGSGMSNMVVALAVSGTDLYAGGGFTTAGAITANYIAKWNGNAWSALGSGMNGWVYALEVSSTNLYAGGYFTTAGGTTVNGIAKWDGSAWSALGSGMNNLVRALAVSGTNLFAGGNFTTAGGTAANYIAKWDGSAWSALGSGMEAGGDGTWVSALALSGTDMYAGGSFTTAGGTAANYIAKWNGNVWSALGSGMNSWVGALVVSGTDLYAGGEFITADGLVANRLAKWDGSVWSALGSGLNDTVVASVVSGTNLYAGGWFTTAGNKASANIAKANIGAARGRFSNMIHSPATGFSCTFLDGSVGQPYRIQTSPSLAAGPWTDFTNFTYTVPVVINVPAAAATNQFFRAITP